MLLPCGQAKKSRFLKKQIFSFIMLLNFWKKFDEDGPRPDIGLGFGEFGGISEKLNVYHTAKIVILQIGNIHK